jgi:hypothetical protein
VPGVAIDVQRRLTAASEQYVGNFFSNPSTAETALQSHPRYTIDFLQEIR